MAYDRPGDPDYEPNPILRAARGSSVSNDVFLSPEFRPSSSGGTYKAPGVGGDAPIDQPTIVSGSQTAAKKAMLESPTAVWESTESYQQKAGTIESIIVGTPTPLQQRESIYVEKRTPEQQYATEIRAIEQARTPSQPSIDGYTAPPRKYITRNMPEYVESLYPLESMRIEKPEYYSVGYGRTEIYHEYDPKTQFKALGFIPQGRPTPGKAYRQDILGFTTEAGKMRPTDESMGSLSVGSAKLSQVSEMLAFSPFAFPKTYIPKAPRPKTATKIYYPPSEQKAATTTAQKAVSKEFGAFTKGVGYNAPSPSRVKSISNIVGAKETQIKMAQESTWRRPPDVSEVKYADDVMISRAKASLTKSKSFLRSEQASASLFPPMTRQRKPSIFLEEQDIVFGRSGYSQLRKEELAYIKTTESVRDITTGTGYRLPGGEKAGGMYREDFLTSRSRLAARALRTPKVIPAVYPIVRTYPKTQTKQYDFMRGALKVDKSSASMTVPRIRTNLTPGIRDILGTQTATTTLQKTQQKTQLKQIERIIGRQGTRTTPESGTPFIPNIKVPKIKRSFGMKVFSMKKGKEFKLNTKSWLKKNRLIGIGDL